MNPQDRMCNGVARRKSAAKVEKGAAEEEGDGIGDGEVFRVAEGDEVEDEVRKESGDGVEIDEGEQKWQMKLEQKERWQMKFELVLKLGA